MNSMKELLWCFFAQFGWVERVYRLTVSKGGETGTIEEAPYWVAYKARAIYEALGYSVEAEAIGWKLA